MPFLELDNLYKDSLAPVTLSTGTITMHWPGNKNVYSKPAPVFVCPSDPSVGPGGIVNINGISWGASSYAANSQAFSARVPGDPQGKWRLQSGFADGVSNTIFYAEKYARCASTSLGLEGGTLWAYCASSLFDLPAPMESPYQRYHSSFAGGPYQSGPSSKFQQQPNPFLSNCDPTRASTGHAAGISVCLGDGSVRTLAASISDVTWWAALTRSANDVLGSDW